ncbi:MAG: PqqD family protein [Bacteroidales bacterium]|nr:PqqD family protein [Bacteroidales bacterium]
MADLDSVFSKAPGIVSRKTGNEYVLVPVIDNIADMNSVFILNETGAFIWEKIDGENTVGEIIEKLVTEFDIEKETATEDVLSFFNRMKDFLIISDKR